MANSKTQPPTFELLSFSAPSVSLDGRSITIDGMVATKPIECETEEQILFNTLRSQINLYKYADTILGDPSLWIKKDKNKYTDTSIIPMQWEGFRWQVGKDPIENFSETLHYWDKFVFSTQAPSFVGGDFLLNDETRAMVQKMKEFFQRAFQMRLEWIKIQEEMMCTLQKAFESRNERFPELKKAMEAMIEAEKNTKEQEKLLQEKIFQLKQEKLKLVSEEMTIELQKLQ